MKNRISSITVRFMIAGLLAAATLVSVEQKTLAAEPPTDPTHAAHVAAGAMPPDEAKGDPALSQQLAQLQAKVAKLEATLARNAARQPVAPVPPASATPGAAAPAGPMAVMKSTAAGGMGRKASPPDGSMNMMEKMDKMMGMMDKMMSMEGGAMPAGAPMAGGGGMGMGMMQNELGGMGASNPPSGDAPGAMKSAGGVDAMGGGAAPPGVDAGMAARMDKMIGMMDTMVRMMDRMTGGTGGPASAAGPTMGGATPGGGSMQPAQGTPAAGGMGMMDDEKDEMGAMQPGQAAPPMGGEM